MKFFLITACVIALASADVSLQLKNLQSSGGFNAGYSSGDGGAGASFSSGDSSGGAGGGFSSGGSVTAERVGIATGGSAGAAASGGSSSGGGGSFSSGGGGGAAAGGGSAQVVKGDSGFLDYRTGGASAGSAGKIIRPVIKAGEPIVSKAFFLHETAAEEAAPGAEVEEREQIVRPRKHYNIVFVKAPGAGGSSAIGGSNVNVFPENEEKTIVYVLTGRNDGGVTVNENGEIQVPEPKPPTKPEVVFVKYNNEADAERAISDIQNQYNNQQSGSVTVVGGAGGGTAFIDAYRPSVGR